MRLFIATLTLAVVALTSTNLSAQQRIKSAVNARLPVTCFGNVVTMQNSAAMVKDLYMYAANDDVRFLNTYAYAISQLQAANTKQGMMSLIAAHGGTEMCTPAYSCTDVNGNPKSVWGFNSCADCAATQPSPPTNPVTCLTSCKLCCSHFATPPSQNCLNSCDANDAC